MRQGFDRLEQVTNAVARPTRAALIGLLIGTGLALVAALGPLVSAVTITVGVVTQVGDAAALPDARMLPAALEGVGAVALIFLLTRRPAGRLRAWSVALIFVSLGAGMAALGLRRSPLGTFDPLTTSGVSQLLRMLTIAAGIKKRVHPHLLRHSFATWALTRGMNPLTLAQILGHSSLVMIQNVYSHLTPADALLKVLAED